MAQTYEMMLRTDPFNQILDGIKTIEYRLHDEKRSLLHKGDYICFTEMLNEGIRRVLLVKIQDIVIAESFVSLKQKLSEKGLLDNEKFFPDEMYKYYSISDEIKYGVMGIKIEIIDTV